jgi:hypothetical protein
VRHLLDGYLLGVERVWHVAELEQEPLLCVKRGRERLPDHTLLYRELAPFDAPGMLSRLRPVGEQLLRTALADQPWSTLGRGLDGRDGLRRAGRGHLWSGLGRRRGTRPSAPKDSCPGTGTQ